MLALNVAAFYLIQKSGVIGAGEWAKLATGWISALPAGAAVALTGILNAQVTSLSKARLVFWHWHNPLPSSEAFSRHGPNGPRVDMAALEAKHGQLPTDPKGPKHSLVCHVSVCCRIGACHASSSSVSFRSRLRLYGLGHVVDAGNCVRISNPTHFHSRNLHRASHYLVGRGDQRRKHQRPSACDLGSGPIKLLAKMKSG